MQPGLALERLSLVGDGTEAELVFALSADVIEPVRTRVALADAQGPLAEGEFTLTAAPGAASFTVALPRVPFGPLVAEWSPALPAAAFATEPQAVPNPLIYVSDPVADEADGTIVFRVSLSDAGTGPVTVSYTTANFTAVSGSDYTFLSGTLTFAPGETSKTVEVGLVDNGSAEDPIDTFRLLLSNASGGTIAKAAGSGLIFDNDTLVATPDVYVRSVAVDEKQGTATFMVTLGEQLGLRSTGTVTVNYTTVNGSATAGTDFGAVSGTLSFAPGESLKLVTVALTDDGDAEGAERFFLDLTGASGATIAQGRAVATIGRSDGTTSVNPLISIADAVVDETDGFVDLVVSLSAPSAAPVTVDWAAANYTAVSGADYQFDSGSLRFEAGETTKTVRIQVWDNSSSEFLERFFVNLSNASGGTLYDGSAEVLVVDNDAPAANPAIVVRSVTVDEKQGSATFMVTLGESIGQASNSTVTVGYATGSLSATAGADFTATSGTLSFAPGESVKLVTIDLIDDADAEGAERFFLSLSDPSGASIQQDIALATIGRSDGTTSTNPLITIADAVVDETDGFVDLVVSLSAPSTSTVSVDWTTANYTAFSGSDYQFIGGRLQFLAGETTKTVRIEIVDNGSSEYLERFFVNLSNASGGTIHDGSAEVLVADNDAPAANPAIVVRSVTVDEKQGSATFMVTLGESIGQASTSTVTVDYATASLSATAGADFTATGGTLSFAPGESVKLVTVDLIDDATAEGAERFLLNLSNASGASIQQGSALATIGRSDGTTSTNPLISITDAVVDETDGFVDLVVSLSAPSTSTVSVDWTTANYTAFSGSDYQFIGGTLQFLAGETTKTVRIEIVDNGSSEYLERFFVNLSNASGGSIHDGSAEVLVADNDALAANPAIVVRSVAVDEKQGSATFMVTLGESIGQRSNGTVTVDYITDNGSATAGADFTPVSGTLSFAPGESVKLVTVDILDDATAEGAEQFVLNLSNASGAGIQQGSALATIGRSDGSTSTNPLITITDAVVDETDGFVDLVVSLSAPSASTVSVDWTTANYTAFSGSDYQFIGGTLQFLAGETTKTVRIEIVDNGTSEFLERFFVNLSNASGGTISKATGQVLVGDNDATATTPGVWVRDVIVDEKQGTAAFVVTLGEIANQASNGPVTVDFSTAASTATAGADFVATSGTLSFAAGETTKVVVVDLLDDGSAEGTERFFLNLSNAVGANIADGNAAARIGLSDTTAATPLITIDDRFVVERAGFVDVAVRLSAASTGVVTVAYGQNNGTAFSGSDYDFLSGTLRFEAGETLKVIRLEVEDNGSAEGIETFTINLSGASGATLADASALVTIVDDDAGFEVLSLGDGDDTYTVDAATDVVVESPDGGTDTVLASVDHTLAAHVENLTLVSPAVNGTGNDLDNVLTGNALANTLTGLGANDTLDGGGGVDTLVGGTGNDTYIVDSTTDTITELAGGGTDTVRSSVGYTLGAELDNLVLTGTSAINGTGNALANTITGNTGNNVLNGGAGIDVLIGGLGNDTYVVDTTTDTLTELAGGGTDTVQSSVSYTLGAELENLLLTGAGAVNGTGNTLANTITGNTANNVLNGGGGIDVLIGGAGNDTYVVDTTTDTVTELAGGGIDTVQSSVGYTLGSELENLLLTGAASVNGTGNTLNNSLTGNTGNNVLNGGDGLDALNGGGGIDVLIGGAGNDTYTVDTTTDTITELAGGGVDRVNSSVSYTLGAELEQLVLTGTASINATGNALANSIAGNAGNNVINGGAGVDSMTGGAGNDTYVVDVSGDIVTELAGGGVDTVQSGLTWTLGAEIENLLLTGASAINGTGNALANTITGNAANNSISGGTGADTMIGGAGNDTYAVDDSADVVVELAGGGSDRVNSSVSYALDAEIETLVLTGTGSIFGVGNALGNAIAGNAGDNLIDGGAGNDSMAGGAGDDTYVVDVAGDIITELAAGGLDTVISALTWTLGAEIENLLLGGTAAINGTGNALDNTITGNAANNSISGGAGADTMAGGAGNDTYAVDDSADVVVELAGGGSDRVNSSVSYVLGAEIETLVLTGTAAINGTGNALGNSIAGNSGNNVIDGGGGNDSMAGGTGNDTYVVDSAGDVVTEAAAGGTDTVQSSVTYALGAEVENLVLTGTGSINGTGNTLANSITGNAGNNSINAGAGADTMAGGAGNDTYAVDNAGDVVIELAGGGTDRINTTVSLTLAAEVETLVLSGAAAINGTGNALANTVVGNSANNVIDGGAGSDALTGGAGADTFVLASLVGSDTIADFASGVDFIRISQAGIVVGDGDTLVEGATTIAGPGGFARTAELVVVTGNIAGAITTASAAAAIGSASSAYTIGTRSLFAVDNGTSSALYLFTAADADAAVEAAELTLLATLSTAPSTTTGDYLFGA